MINIKLINKIAKIGTDVFDKEKYTVSDNAENPVALMVRSAKLHDTVFDKSTIAIARAGAGVNNIPCQRCAEEGKYTELMQKNIHFSWTYKKDVTPAVYSLSDLLAFCTKTNIST